MWVVAPEVLRPAITSCGIWSLSWQFARSARGWGGGGPCIVNSHLITNDCQDLLIHSPNT
jgi:hypothetical protein